MPMLGSVISKRWVVSLALVGLVSLFMASYSAVWANPASASSGQVLTTLDGVGGSVSVVHGSDTVFNVVAKNQSGGTDLDGTITYLWSLSGCGSISSPANTASITYTAAAGCTATLMVWAKQNGAGQVDATDTAITVGPVPATPTPVVIDAALDSVVEELASTEVAVLLALLVNSELDIDVINTVAAAVGGSKETTISIGADKVDLPVGTKLRFPSNATGRVIIVTITAPSSDTPGLSSYLEGFSSSTELGAILGSSAIDISIYGEDGNPLNNFRLDKPAEVCLPYTDEDLATAYGGIDGMAVYHYNGADWVKTNSSVDLNAKLVCGYSSTFSPFVLGLDDAPPAPPGEAGLPVTGDYSPSFASLMMALMAGVALVGGGVLTLRRARRVRENG
jgi:hypothetical protein